MNCLQLKRLDKRPSLGLSRVGSISRWGSGDIDMAISNYPWIHPKAQPQIIDSAEFLDPFIKTEVDACEEASLNALFQTETVVWDRQSCPRKTPCITKKASLKRMME
ncbi:P1 family peptidase [Desulfosporosinus shakirovi]|uniref:P1 family peptidase n=1 Tax=Desulfosporosinus shakirovi TaxID=2885154 RepID=UPI00289A2E1E|nr:P1 family peptidase [Desulfosporosinus sp. SRJS8]MCB8818751.1 P1 family peptidase [Desulfosporosinus sp. SRJS8]